jgi:hypothetical protein
VTGSPLSILLVSRGQIQFLLSMEKNENTVLITEDGCENLSYLVPRTVEEIEKIMAEKGITDILEELKR